MSLRLSVTSNRGVGIDMMYRVQGRKSGYIIHPRDFSSFEEAEQFRDAAHPSREIAQVMYIIVEIKD